MCKQKFTKGMVLCTALFVVATIFPVNGYSMMEGEELVEKGVELETSEKHRKRVETEKTREAEEAGDLKRVRRNNFIRNYYGIEAWNAGNFPIKTDVESVSVFHCCWDLLFDGLSDSVQRLMIPDASNELLGVLLNGLDKFPCLISLDLTGSIEITDIGLNFLPTTLTKLNLHSLKEITPTGLEIIFSRCSDLTELILCYTSITALPNSIEFSGLTTLSLTSCKKLECLSGLEKFPCLKDLSLGFCEAIPDEELRHLPVSLTELDLNHCKITDDGLRHISNLRNLRNVNLSGTKVTDAGLSHLPEGLTHLNLNCADITDFGLETIVKRCLDLTCLDLSGTKITNITILLKLAKLTHLNLSDCEELKDYKGILDALTEKGVSYVKFSWLSGHDEHNWEKLFRDSLTCSMERLSVN